MRKILGSVRKAVQDYDMIKDGDKVTVGVSGGKDSMTLLYALKLFQRFSPVKYELEAVTLGLGFEDFDVTPIQDFCDKIDVPYIVEHTNIKEIVFDIRKEKNPCSLCANMRRGALHDVMHERGSRVLALGHHADDAIETFFMNMFYTGRLNTFSPKTYLDRKEIHVIRPLIYVSEGEIKGAIKRHDMPVVASPCPMDKNTKREEMKAFMEDVYKKFPDGRQKMLRALQNKEQFGVWF